VLGALFPESSKEKKRHKGNLTTLLTRPPKETEVQSKSKGKRVKDKH
jgi:hypothetical protein